LCGANTPVVPISKTQRSPIGRTVGAHIEKRTHWPV
jgi:hypothetical protein